MYLGLLAAASNIGVQPGPFVVRDNVQPETDTPVTCWPQIYMAAPTNSLGPATITGNNLRTLAWGIVLGRVSHADVERNTTTFIPGFGCGVSTGVELNDVPSGLITHNTFIGANPVATLNSSAATVCGNRTTAKGRYDQPEPC
ncbi:hypothetical protein [Streptomyces sp. NPDC051909]|uniref:hypothetical protein n=1 Tax=Streptomyces sp. NPDC051909 TaxID=3154944 RepID=UPI00343C24D5